MAAPTLTASAAVVSAEWGDTSAYSGDPSGNMTISYGGGDISSGENIGIYHLIYGNGSGTLVECLSPQLPTDYGFLNYTVVSVTDGSVAGLGAVNSLPFTSASLLAAAQIFDTYAGTVTTQQQGWGLAAAIYSAMNPGLTVGISSPAVQTAYNTYSQGYSGDLHPSVVLLVPYPYGPYPAGEPGAGQILLVPASAVPEPATVVAGGLGLLLCGLRARRGASRGRTA